eukprot:CAMPEP_0185510986 /NCGR_PEP_ID=MMETSP1366-20130426/50500_1 /TAXON_ID=38817 /ORGANISM="Gephyrocapsa oceanica, Strain RCC1303" /LENGTH=165 /DNA_ID=CAMNT_0028121517 /DNA_START=67 /DNA_END=565 /DNA_ORIENTATION=+
MQEPTLAGRGAHALSPESHAHAQARTLGSARSGHLADPLIDRKAGVLLADDTRGVGGSGAAVPRAFSRLGEEEAASAVGEGWALDGWALDGPLPAAACEDSALTKREDDNEEREESTAASGGDVAAVRLLSPKSPAEAAMARAVGTAIEAPASTESGSAMAKTAA